MRYTIWSSAGKFEWIIWDGDNILRRSLMVFRNYSAAKRAMRKALTEIQA